MRALVLGFHKFPEGQVKADIVLYCTVLYCTVQVVVEPCVVEGVEVTCTVHDITPDELLEVRPSMAPH